MSPSARPRITVELASRETVEQALPLLRVQFEEHHVALEAAELEHAVRGLVEVDGRGRVLLAREGGPEGDVIGVAVLAHTWTLEHGGKCSWLDELYVVPSRRDGGVGTTLLLRAIDTARGDDCRAIELEVDAEHARAERLYLREGFELLSRRRFARKL